MVLNPQIYGMIADLFLIAGALGAGCYCIVLSRRLRRLNDLEGGVGGAVAVLAAQVDDLAKMMKSAQSQVTESSEALGDMTSRAEHAARQIELMLAALHDLPESADPLEQAVAAAPKAPETEKVGGPMIDQNSASAEGAISKVTAAPADEGPSETAVMFRPRQTRGVA